MASGKDSIDGRTLHIAAPTIEDRLLHMINSSIKECKFATQWKHQMIHPRHKKKRKPETCITHTGDRENSRENSGRANSGKHDY